MLALHSSWGPEFKWLCNPVLSCHSCALAWFACPIGVFVQYAGFHAFPYIALGTVLLVGALVGKLLCGWVCPFGYVQDLLHMIPSPKFTLPRWTAKIKYFVLVAGVIVFPAIWGGETVLSFCRVCPASALEVTIPNHLIHGIFPLTTLTIIKLSVLLSVLVLAVFSSRSFCKMFCPIGALLAPLNLISFWRIKLPTERCAQCHKCDTVCAVHGNPSSRVSQGIPANVAAECIVCHDCQKLCPHREATGQPGAELGNRDSQEPAVVVRVAN